MCITLVLTAWAIEVRSLAQRLLIFCRRVANVITSLNAADKSCIGIDFVRLKE